MHNLDHFSPLLQRAVDSFSKLPGIGRKSALRLALYLLKQDKDFTHEITDGLNAFIDGIQYCHKCHNICDSDLCSICSDPRRDSRMLCVVENVRDVMAIERTGQYNGYYHVLGGIISPMDSMGPNDLFIADIPERIKKEGIKEVVLALSTTMEGDTTNFYIYRLLKDLDVLVTVIARGISLGDELEYADELTLGRSIEHRINFASTLRE
ncbi:recombination mediator RecR [Porphyromonadaceae bacterium W3.11]|nr:recombination mediator RecR [Porphyromonadaceae bacterium W3.11]